MTTKKSLIIWLKKRCLNEGLAISHDCFVYFSLEIRLTK